MSGSRTEAPTPRRLAEARRRGEVGSSRELCAAGALAGGLLALAAAGPGLGAGLARHLRAALEAAARAEPAAAATASLVALATALAPVLAGAFCGGLCAGLASTGLLFAPALAAPRLSRLDLAAGLRRLFSTARAADVALGAAKAFLAVGVGALFLGHQARALALLPRLSTLSLAAALPALVRPLLVGLAALLLFLGLADLALSRRRHGQALRMSRQEVLREHREQEGDPRLRAERRRTHQLLALAGPVARATVLVVNPTRLAVAVIHRLGDDQPPRVLAKGAGRAAARLRRAARRAGVPVVRDVALARSLFRLAEVGEAIPEELYQAAAAVLVQVHGRAREVLG